MNFFPRASSIFPTIVLVLVCVFAASAQSDRPELTRRGENDRAEDKTVLGSIRGRVVLPDGNYVKSNVRITLQTFRAAVTTIYTDNQGQFEFPDLIPGNYQLEIDPTDREHFEPSNESVQVYKGLPSILNLTLKPRDTNRTRSTGAVSVAELDSSISSSARKEFEKATAASQKGLSEEAIVHLRKAIAISPVFVMAYNDLGVQLLAQGKLDEAAELLRKAVSLDPKAFNPALNYGIVLVYLHRFAEANESLSRALTMQSNSAAAHLYSGLAQKGLGNNEQAAGQWKLAYETGGVEYAVALFYLGQNYRDEGDKSLAVQYLEKYLSVVPNAANAEQARRMIATLRQL
jgi:tetratricopeptide (TPR) repeat protein